MVRLVDITGADLPKTRIYDGKRYTQYRTYLTRSSLKSVIDKLRNKGWSVIYIEWHHRYAKPAKRYTIYRRKK